MHKLLSKRRKSIMEKVTDVLDTFKFSSDNYSLAEIEMHYHHAIASIYESIILHDGILLSMPQFFDGFLLQEHQQMKSSFSMNDFFKLFEKNICKIGIYYMGERPAIRNMTEYLVKMVLSKNYIYSASPHLTQALQEEDTEQEQEAKNGLKAINDYLIAVGTPQSPKFSNSLIGMELHKLFTLIRCFLDIERKNSDVYKLIPVRSETPDFSFFIRSSLESIPLQEQKDLLGIEDNDVYKKIIAKIYSCKTRSEFIQHFPSYAKKYLSREQISEIVNIINLYYNKYSLMPFGDAEIHVSSLSSKKIAVLGNTLSNIRKFDYENTEIISRRDFTSGVLSISEAMEIRKEILSISAETNLSQIESANRFANCNHNANFKMDGDIWSYRTGEDKVYDSADRKGQTIDDFLTVHHISLNTLRQNDRRDAVAVLMEDSFTTI